MTNEFRSADGSNVAELPPDEWLENLGSGRDRRLHKIREIADFEYCGFGGGAGI
jgi:hypothetical protein